MCSPIEPRAKVRAGIRAAELHCVVIVTTYECARLGAGATGPTNAQRIRREEVGEDSITWRHGHKRGVPESVHLPRLPQRVSELGRCREAVRDASSSRTQ